MNTTEKQVDEYKNKIDFLRSEKKRYTSLIEQCDMLINEYTVRILKSCDHDMVIDYVDERTHMKCNKCGYHN